MPLTKLNELHQKLGYTFKSPDLLELACIHKSFGNEHRSEARLDKRDNERLEFLGDAILDFLVSELLVHHHPHLSEGDLSKLRAGLVNEKTLAKIAKSLDLGKFISLGKGEDQTGGRAKDSILSSTLEAIVAAIYLDGGFEAVQKWAAHLFDEKVKSSLEHDDLQDYKTKLQEVAQALFKVTPRYEVIFSEGPDHDKTFEVQVQVGTSISANGSGKSKKEAEQNAAWLALKELDEKNPGRIS